MAQITVYPPPPAHVAPEITAPSPAFRAQVSRVIFAILAFVLVYLVLILLALVLVWACVKLGLLVMFGLRINLFLLLIGAGIILMGAMVLFFLVKFIFSKPEDLGERGVQIFESDEPVLFDFIRKIAKEVGAPFPKKVFLIPEVNASVFYNSSFWSLILPAPKNLNIGLGLVNALNMSELKAVLAHEFGHFSQESMRLGSYVYYVNKVIYDMLNKNTGWTGALEAIAAFHQILWMFAYFAVNIVMGIQWVLQKMYGLINRQYLKLSREMEFHADAIGAAVSGGNNSIQSLRQVTVANHIFNTTLEQCDRLLKDNKVPDNIYTGQATTAHFFGKTNELPVRDGRVTVPPDFLDQQRHNRVVFQNQWESHPSLEDREAHIRKLGLHADVVEDTAWKIFANPAKWQVQLTSYLYQSVNVKTEKISDSEFAQSIEQYLAVNTMPSFYKGYFDNYLFLDAHLADRAKKLSPQPATKTALAVLFTENYGRQIAGLDDDLNILENIRLGQIDTKTFDFDGEKYPASAADTLKEKLTAEREILANRLLDNEHRIFDTFYADALAKSSTNAEKLQHAYETALDWQRWNNAFEGPFTNAVTVIFQLDSNRFVCTNELAAPFTQLATKDVVEIGHLLNTLPEQVVFPESLPEKIARLFQSEPINYGLDNYQPHMTNLIDLYQALTGIRMETMRIYFDRLRTVLELQLKD